MLSVLLGSEWEGKKVIRESVAGIACPPENPGTVAGVVLAMHRRTESERRESVKGTSGGRVLGMPRRWSRPVNRLFIRQIIYGSRVGVMILFGRRWTGEIIL